MNILYTRSERSLPLMIENSKKHHITLGKGWIGFFLLDMIDQDEPEYQTWSPYELTNTIFSTDERYNDCFHLHSTVPSQRSNDFSEIIIIYVTVVSIFQNPIGFDIAFLLLSE